MIVGLLAIASVIAIFWSDVDSIPHRNNLIDNETSYVAERKGEVDQSHFDSSVRNPESPKEHSTGNVVDFGKLGEVQVIFREYFADLPTVSEHRLMDSYYELVELALSGSGGAAFQIYRSLKMCENSVNDEQKLEETINRLRDTHILEIPGNKPLHLHSADLQAAEDNLRGLSKYCEGVATEQIDLAEQKWLTLAADVDFLPAADRLSWNLYEEREYDDALAYFQKSWMLGNRFALKGMYSLYEEGSNSIEPDQITATAYLYLDNQLLKAMNSMDNAGQIYSRMLEASDRQLSIKMQTLMPADRERALTVAREILIANPNCCVSW